MAKSFKSVALVAALCFVSMVGFAHCHDYLTVEGKVYCDTCRVQFQTKLTKYISGAQVRLECRNVDNVSNVTFTKEAVTNAAGSYSISVDGDHEEDICEVFGVKSPRSDCDEIAELTNGARIVLTKNNGVASPLRFANSIGFLKKEALPACAEILRELGFLFLESLESLGSN